MSTSLESSSIQQGWRGEQEVQVVGGDDHGLDQIVGEARRTLGLYRIDYEDLDRMKQEQFGGAKSLEIPSLHLFKYQKQIAFGPMSKEPRNHFIT